MPFMKSPAGCLERRRPSQGGGARRVNENGMDRVTVGRPETEIWPFGCTRVPLLRCAGSTATLTQSRILWLGRAPLAGVESTIFAATAVGSTSAAQPVTLTNNGSAPLHLHRAYVAGPNPDDFSLTGAPSLCMIAHRRGAGRLTASDARLAQALSMTGSTVTFWPSSAAATAESRSRQIPAFHPAAKSSGPSAASASNRVRSRKASSGR